MDHIFKNLPSKGVEYHCLDRCTVVAVIFSTFSVIYQVRDEIMVNQKKHSTKNTQKKVAGNNTLMLIFTLLFSNSVF